MIDIFRSYTNIGIATIHTWTLIIIVMAFIIPFFKIKGRPLLDKFILSVSFGALSKGSLEFAYILFLGGTSIGDLILVALGGGLIYVYNIKYKIIKINKIFIALCVLELGSLLALHYSGFFALLSACLSAQGGYDPHNWIWGITKANGMLMWLSLIDQRM